MWPLILSLAWADEHVGVDPIEALADLVDGNRRFVAGTSTHEGSLPEDRERLAGGQAPHTMILTCADSRVAPEILFDQGLGELFVVRSAGNNADAHGVASLEYATTHLGSRQLIVMGHTSCGAVKAALHAHGASAGSPSLDTLVDAVIECTGPMSEEAEADPEVREAVWVHTLGARDALLRDSPLLAEAAATGLIVVRAAVYDLLTGVVAFEKARPAEADGHQAAVPTHH
jgi:carbonic anhydrase